MSNNPASSGTRTQPRRRRLLLIAQGAALAVVGCSTTAWRQPSNPISPDPAACSSPAPFLVGPLAIHADFPISTNHPLLAELAAERDLVARRLEIDSPEASIHVHLFADEASYRRHVAAEFPEFAERRALFAEAAGEFHVYALWSDRVAEDLRHEVAHAYLHAAMPQLPLWLDEGLAEFFEVAGGHGLNRAHLELLRAQRAAGAWQPDLTRLEQLHSASSMTQLDYAEAWLWVHFLLEGPEENKAALNAYVRALTDQRPAGPLSEMIQLPIAQAKILEHLAKVPHSRADP